MFTQSIQKIKDLNLPSGKFAVFGSGPIAVRKIRDANDVDMIVTAELFEELKKNPDWHFIHLEKEGRITEKLVKDEFELYRDWYPGEWDINKLISESEMIEGVPFVRLSDVIKYKEIRGWEKDKKDLELIKDFNLSNKI